ncbi:MAG: AtpZ/AtpI family protein [Phycisphaerales bacterium]|nr:AtpZ/AtpI family protein [Phycisphaerales bacterium]
MHHGHHKQGNGEVLPEGGERPADPYQAAIDAAPKIPELLREPVGIPMPGRDAPKLGAVGSLMDAGKAWGAALNFVFTIIAGLMLGWLCDYFFKTRPWGVLGGLAAGFVLAFVQIVRNTLKTEAKEKAERERRKSKSG